MFHSCRHSKTKSHAYICIWLPWILCEKKMDFVFLSALWKIIEQSWAEQSKASFSQYAAGRRHCFSKKSNIGWWHHSQSIFFSLMFSIQIDLKNANNLYLSEWAPFRSQCLSYHVVYYFSVSDAAAILPALPACLSSLLLCFCWRFHWNWFGWSMGWLVTLFCITIYCWISIY